MSTNVIPPETPVTTTIPVLPARRAWVVGLLLASGLFAGLFFLPQELRAQVPAEWLDLLYLPALIGQTLAVWLLLVLLLEWWGQRRRRREIDELREEDREGQDAGAATWASRAWCQTRNLPQQRLTTGMRRQNLGRAAGLIEGGLNNRWRLYLLLALAPAAIGLVLGELSLRCNPQASRTYAEHFFPLWVGTIEGGVLLLLALLVRWRASALVQRWRQRVEQLDHLQVPAAPTADPQPQPAPVPSPPRPPALKPPVAPSTAGDGMTFEG